jgi:hypothetical protein
MKIRVRILSFDDPSHLELLISYHPYCQYGNLANFKMAATSATDILRCNGSLIKNIILRRKLTTWLSRYIYIYI